MDRIRTAWMMGAILLALAAQWAPAGQTRVVTESARQVPVAASVDVAVVGGSSGAVAAAVAAARAGARVYLIAPRPYLGEDLAGTLRLWLEPGESVKGTPAATIWGDQTFVTPLHFKKALDNKLLAAKVDFLYSACFADLLTDAAGKPCGVVMVNRAGRQAVVARTIIDATEDAAVARLAGARFTPFTPGAAAVKWIAIAGQPSTGGGLKARRLELPLELYTNAGGRPAPAAKAVTRKGEPIPFTPAHWYEYTMTLELKDESWPARAELEQRVRDLAYNPTQQFAADTPYLVPPTWVVADRPAPAAAKADDLAPEACRPAGVERLWVLSGRAAVSRAQAEALGRPGPFMKLGERVGRAAAAQAKALAEPAGVRVARGAAPAAPEPGDTTETLGGLRPFLPCGRIPQAAGALPVLGSYDVVVVGGGTAGAPAGIAAARKGAKTLVIEYLDGLGGVGTLGMIGAYFRGNRTGFNTEMPEHPVEQRMEWYRAALRKAGGQAWFGTMGAGALLREGRVAGVVVATPQGRGVVLAKAVVDATGNSDIAIAAGAGYQFVEDFFALQDSHVPPREVGAWNMNGGYPPISDADPIDLRAAFLARGREKKDAFDWGQIIDSRERRRIVGDFTLDWLDCINQRTFPDAIAWTKTSYDSHGYQIHPFFMLRPPRYPENIAFEFKAYVPYRCLLPRGVEGMLVTGLGLSAHRDALPIVRMQPDLMNQGYAAGYAAAMAAEAGITPRQIDVKALQKHLAEIGNLEPAVLGHQDSYPLSKEKIAGAVAVVKKEFANLEVVMAAPQESLPLLRQAYKVAEGPDKVAYAEVLGVMGDASGLETLMKEGRRLLTSADADLAPPAVSSNVHAADRLSQLVWALGGTRDRRVLPLLGTLAGEIGEKPNRFRAVVVSMMRIGDRAAVPTLERIVRGLPPKSREKGETNEKSEKREEMDVREILATVALYRCGDTADGLARRKLEEFEVGNSGPRAELAAKVLATPPGK